MPLPAALACVGVAAILGNRILSILAGLLLKVPMVWLLVTVISLDLIQIPIYYWLYENGSSLLQRLPAFLKRWAERFRRAQAKAAWAHSMGAAGVFFLALLPSFGGGIWTAVLLAHGLKLHKTVSSILMALASCISFVGLYWILNTLVSTVRYLCQ